ncbi:TetR/AcrR family transcriptional regulator [Quadrisphaera setariae]|uniref:TetR/AcrR family transcriptional regulator n=1 Tax=Quadrisphaera setariae TaxID=2593304 RepID=UPI001C9BCB50|nr:TetR family transcriptional regulator C-terminal domain-containing protein [Quadrisphaera setariae]
MSPPDQHRRASGQPRRDAGGRGAVLAAVVDVLLTDGFEGVSIRRVATRAGVSIGAVQHHFPTKDAMLEAAMEHASEVVAEDVRAALAAPGPPAERLRAVVAALVGARPDQRPATVLWVARLARAEVHPPAAQRHAEEWGFLEQLLDDLLAAALPALAAAPRAQEAAALLALADGLAVAVAREPARMPPGRALAVAAAHLDRLLAG